MENQTQANEESGTQGFMPQMNVTPKISFWENNKMFLKSLLIAGLTLLMLIPASFVCNLVYERESRQEEVINEVSSKWASAQTIKGPILMVPYWVNVTQADKSVQRFKKVIYVMPDQLLIDGKLNPEKRHRSIYDVTLYKSALKIQGAFRPLDLSALGIARESIIDQEIKLLVGIADVRGIEQDIQLNINGDTAVMEGGVPENDFLSKGLSRNVDWDMAQSLSFSFNLKLKGSGSLQFIPVGKTTKVNINSPWLHPKFDGKFIPAEEARIDKNGFDAHWNVLQISSGIPTVLLDQKISLDDNAFGVKLIEPINGYAKTQRAVKYAILFISLTFIIFFFIEVLQKRNIHPLQYLLVGLALIIFYTLLLSFTEYCGFNLSYCISTIATMTLIGLYVWGIFKSGKIAVSFSAALLTLYAYIFVLIQLEDLAFLFGSVGLFIILAIIMYYSRKIDWYASRKQISK